ncbi:MAG TPA: MarR family transcriptional regulator [Eggerthellaceae bacterium]|nr:MarR family transcriptional regulator [Eggerthellaceae bacterium]
MLTKNQFLVLADAAVHGRSPQRTIAMRAGVSLGTINTATRALRKSGALDTDGRITETGRDMLEPYKVRNAVIMAAGLSTRFAPISYEQPKGLLRVRGEVLIERQIRQLKEAGIDDITVVVGYMKERFFYLEDMFGVRIRVNEEYAHRNNNSTLMLVREQLGNTYICSSDNYFTENVFDPYVYQSFYSAAYFAGKTDEYLLETGPGKRITGVTIGGSDAFGMLGHAYFDDSYAKTFRRILEEEYDRPGTATKLWEDIYIEHLPELPMVMRTYGEGVIHEFDSLDELATFDPAFIENVDSSILDNICKTLHVERADISGIEPISQGLTNLSFKFEAAGRDYVYRHPGAGTDAIINREAEAFSQEVARKLGLDDTFIFEDAQEGWKISYYLHDCSELDYHDWDQVRESLHMVRTLHQSSYRSKWNFDVYEKAKEIVALIDERHRASFDDFKTLFDLIDGLAAHVASDGTPQCLCHNDFYSPNLLVSQGKMYLIDWEYSGMSDYASDLGTYICCSDYTYDEACAVLAEYFQRDPTPAELAHCMSYIAISSYYWFVWALYKDACGAPVGEWLYLWYKNAKLFGYKAREIIDAQSG